jgi:apoptosis-inducing factor 3
MLGLRQRHTAVPFFWSKHCDLPIRYVGHAERWDAIEVDGSIAQRNCVVPFSRSDCALAVAVIGCDREAPRIEAEMEKQVLAA